MEAFESFLKLFMEKISLGVSKIACFKRCKIIDYKNWIIVSKLVFVFDVKIVILLKYRLLGLEVFGLAEYK
jgi:hypothetical protein